MKLARVWCKHNVTSCESWTLVLNRYLSRLSIFIFPEKLRSMGYRALARRILHIYTAADHRGAQRYSFLVEVCDGKAEADFAIKRRFFHGIYRLLIPAFDVYEYFIHSRIKYASRIYISYSTRTVWQRYVISKSSLHVNRDRKRKIIFASILEITEMCVEKIKKAVEKCYKKRHI